MNFPYSRHGGNRGNVAAWVLAVKQGSVAEYAFVTKFQNFGDGAILAEILK